MSITKHERRSWPLHLVWPEDRIDSAFRDMFRGFFRGEGLDTFFEGKGLMKVEEYVEDGTVIIRAEMPGIDPEKDVDISIDGGILHLKAHREEKTEEDKPEGYRSEFHYGSFERSIRLPSGVSEKDITASYKDGILEVRVPAPQVAPPTAKIAVQRG